MKLIFKYILTSKKSIFVIVLVLGHIDFDNQLSYKSMKNHIDGGIFYNILRFIQLMKRLAFLLPVLAILMVLPFSCKKANQSNHSSLKLESDTLSERYYLQGDTSQNYVDISTQIEYPKSFPDKNVLAKVRNTVTKDFFPDADTTYATAGDLLKSYVKDYEKFFRETEAEGEKQASDDYQMDDPWWNRQKMKVRLCDDKLFSYTVSTDRFTGGAHGGRNYKNTVIDLKTGEKVTENDLFTERIKPIITSMIIGKILEKNGIGKPEELGDIGYFDASEINLNNNFFITQNGLTYTFNEYEIAAYSVGSTEIFLDFKSIESFIKPDSPISYLLE